MANTYVDYTATAAQTDFAFSFPYLEDSHVTVEIDGVATTDFTIVTTPSTKVVLDSGATAGQIVRVRRKSQPDTNLVDFVNGSVLTESELDRAYLHNRYLAEEIAELNDASLQIGAGGTNWDGKSLQIKNLADPTDTTDATNKTYVDQKVNQASTGAAFPPTKWTFTGTAGANTTYSVTGAEINGDTAYDVSIDGSVKEPTADYTVDPDTDTLTIVTTLSGGEDIVVIQRGFGIAISTGTIGSAQIANGSITAAKLDTDAVTTAKIEDGAVTSAKTSLTNLVINETASVISASAFGGVEVGGPSGGYIDLKSPDTDDYDGRVIYDGVSTNLIGKDGVKIASGSLGQTLALDVNTDGNVGIKKNANLTHALDVAGDVNVSLGNTFKINGANFLLDEDAMTSNSDTQGATQQSIKAYVDSQSSDLTVFAKGFIDTSNNVSRSTNITSSSYSSSNFTITFTSGAASPHATHIVQVTPRVTSTTSLANYALQYVWNSATELKVSVSGVANLDGISLVIFE